MGVWGVGVTLRVTQSPVMMGGRDEPLYGFIAQAFLHYLGSLKICVPEIFDGDKFEEKLDEPGSKIRLLEIWKLFFFFQKNHTPMNEFKNVSNTNYFIVKLCTHSSCPQFLALNLTSFSPQK